MYLHFIFTYFEHSQHISTIPTGVCVSVWNYLIMHIERELYILKGVYKIFSHRVSLARLGMEAGETLSR